METSLERFEMNSAEGNTEPCPLFAIVYFTRVEKQLTNKVMTSPNVKKIDKKKSAKIDLSNPGHLEGCCQIHELMS